MRLLSCVVGCLIALSPVVTWGADLAGNVQPRPRPQLNRDDSPVNDGKVLGLPTYADVIAPVQKAVVSVFSTKIVRHTHLSHPLFPLYEDKEEDSKERGLGSGVIVSTDGYILTNNHVVEGADELNVQLTDGREFKAQIVGADSKTDIAVIKIETDHLPTVVLADSDKLRVGDIVFAVGNPLGVGQTVTMGIVSAISREVGILDEVQGYENFIQTDAAINQGNSGGALIDAKGRLIGINSAILSTTHGNIGIGFAVPVNLASTIMDSLLETGSVSRGFLGVQVDGLSNELAETLGLKKETHGVLVSELTKGGPAEKAGVRRRDVIVSVNGKTIASRQELRLLVSQLRPDASAELKLIRENQEKTIEVKLGNLAENSGDELLPGVHVTRLTDELRRSLSVDPRVEDGLVITSIEKDSLFVERLQVDMVVIEINRLAVSDLETAKRVLIPGRNLFLVNIHGISRYLSVPVK